MSDLLGNHIVGFLTRRLKYLCCCLCVHLFTSFGVSDCGEDDLVCKKEAESLEAIETLHKQIDDDQSGNIDQSESDEVSINQ